MRGYRDKVIDKHLSEVKHHERMSALQNRTKTHKKILLFVTEFRPSVPNLKKIIMHKWYLIENEPMLTEIFKDPPIISYKRGKSLQDILLKLNHEDKVKATATEPKIEVNSLSTL